MQSTLTQREADPHDAFAIKPDVVLAARANANPPSPDPVHEALSHLSRRRAQMALGAAAAGPATPVVDTTFRATAVAPARAPGERSAIGRWTRNASIAFLFALGSAAAAEAWKHHGDTARAMISSWVPPSVLASFAPAETPAPAAQPDSPPVQAAAADQAPAQPSPAAAAPAAAASPADSTQLLPSMAHDLAAMGQQIEQLKASIEELRAGQAQMSRDIAKNSEPEQNLRPRVAAVPPRPVAPLPRKPRPAAAPAQAATASTLPPPPYAAPAYPQPALSQPAPPPQATFQPDGEPVMRPPMPLH
jgi:hypothetical protein